MNPIVLKVVPQDCMDSCERGELSPIRKISGCEYFLPKKKLGGSLKTFCGLVS